MPPATTAINAGGGGDNNNHHHHGWKLRNYRLTTSILHGAVDLDTSCNFIEKPPEEESTVDIEGGRTVTFAMMSNVTQRPKISHTKIKRAKCVNLNVEPEKSSVLGRFGHRLQRYLTKKNVPSLTVLYLVAFFIMNAVFALLWSAETDGCCDDPTMTFWDHLDFAVQTSSTIGYGGYRPKGRLNNALVVLQTVLAICLATVYAGLLFFKFITPSANFQFSEVITLSNVMGHPCLEIRVGNADGNANKLINADASLCVTSIQHYRCPHEFNLRTTEETEELELFVNSRHRLDDVWTLRHFIDDKSPLYGFRFDEFPGNTIRSLSLNVKAIQRATKNEVFGQAVYHLEDIMVGHRFEDQVTWDAGTRTAFIDYSKMSSTTLSMVWHPKSTGTVH
ncbi:unnamed protein product [Cylindrotheca closterium]|uniref:Inward rectifier potassium channel C-terminal domain-containing protein n=1 Tax=Cylindrotheca closterium TaxID=2856 RepID=A0AAD2FPV0_9STRA|nr:unnamed protein product [Cylindrotheca closterium]